MSLATPHPLWTSAGSSSYQVTMATIQARMISRRYRTEQLISKWSPHNDGTCKAPSCRGSGHPENLQHILAECGALAQTRSSLHSFTTKYCQNVPQLKPILNMYCNTSHPLFTQFILDCSVLPEPIRLAQELGQEVICHLFRITHTWCYCLHKARLKLLGRWHKF